MGNTPFFESSFEISEEEWLETLSKVSSEKGENTFWVSLQSRIVTLLSTPFQLHVHERAIYLLPRQKSSAGPRQIEAIVFLPEPLIGGYERRMYEKNHVRLSVTYPVTRIGDRQSTRDFVHFVIATSEEYLTVPNSELLLQ